MKSAESLFQICAYCGRLEGLNWTRHFKRYHKRKTCVALLLSSDQLLGTPWCTNWRDVISEGAKPVGVLSAFAALKDISKDQAFTCSCSKAYHY